MEDRRNKYLKENISSQSNNYNFKIDLKFDITELDLMCAYIVSNNRSIRRGNIINLKNVFNIMNMDIFGNDQECLARIDFINKGIDARLNKNLVSSDMILRDITGGLGVGNAFSFRELNNTEIAWVNDNMSNILKYAHFQVEADPGLALLTKLKSSDYASRGQVVQELEQWVANLQNKIRRSRSDNLEDLTFSLIGDRFIECMTETYRQITSPGNNLVFGTQALNLLTGGGLQAGRVYTLLGLPGEGKSSTLLEMAIQLKKYNKNYVCKDPTKRPCVVLLVMENGIKETVQRMFSMCIHKNMEEYGESQMMDVFLNTGIHISDDDPIDLIIKYKSNLSVDTSYLYTMVDDLEDEGYEVICVLQDYLKRIRSVDGSFGGDVRLQYGAIVNEFKTFAVAKNMPLVTASQLNRVATTSIDQARLKNKSDLVRLLGRGNVGESNLILENSDWIALLATEINPVTGEKYLGMQRAKSRYYIPDIYCAYMPYVKDSIKLVEDVYMPHPVHKNTMVPEDEQIMINGMSSNMLGTPNKVKSFTEFDDTVLENVDSQLGNIFESASAIAAMNMSNMPKIQKKQLYRLVQNK